MRAWLEQRPLLRTYRAIQVVLGPPARWIFRTRRVGLRKIPKRGPCILVSNHMSNLDPVLVVLAMHRPVIHLAKREIFAKPWRSYFFQRMGGQIPVHRDNPGANERAMQAAVKALESGMALGIYPEAHRSADGRVHRGKPGVGRLAYLTGAPCYPVAIGGTYRVWPKGKKWPKPFVPTRILVGEPRAYKRDPARAQDRAACQQVADELMEDVARLLGQSLDGDSGNRRRP